MKNASETGRLIHQKEDRLLKELREARRALRATFGTDRETRPAPALTMGQRIADKVASAMGSWRFIIIQSSILLFWIILNVTAYIKQWDPYPFILLNLALSFQAAYAAPFIMMSQNRQQDIDRLAAATDHQINVKAELEIESLHQKLDALRETEVIYLTKAVQDLTDLLNRSGICSPPAAAEPLA
ncbi:DUF1003 domain-containing protein (plasmid) [Sphingomonas paeninsulae]|uniref:DUF1003 domain-containing protein n=1 Tax=Sphingomonas paeninsulae TaxID=2319844 RepID=A0A494TJQ2_SPHPE|nr:DUF1003 domain-containing protein [Sphingomonas paeninsulae]AYJ85355.1 DUF1003 domain-containing protein [Sphingomonas paeninsulae]